jgi:hypothetical protein
LGGVCAVINALTDARLVVRILCVATAGDAHFLNRKGFGGLQLLQAPSHFLIVFATLNLCSNSFHCGSPCSTQSHLQHLLVGWGKREEKNAVLNPAASFCLA